MDVFGLNPLFEAENVCYNYVPWFLQLHSVYTWDDCLQSIQNFESLDPAKVFCDVAPWTLQWFKDCTFETKYSHLMKI